MSAIIYLKRYQRHGIYHYAKVWPDRHPPLSEVVNFLNAIPLIEHREYNLEQDSDRIEFQALFEAWEWIDEAEFKRAYKRATAVEFTIYINGKPVQP